MDNFDIYVYVREVQVQSSYALAAIQCVDQSLVVLNSLTPDVENYGFFRSEVFRNIHSFLTHASNVSLLFWPTNPRKKKGQSSEEFSVAVKDVADRGEVVRGLFDMSKSGCLEKRSLRDHLEHFDERLDDWRKGASKHFIIDNIGSEQAIVGVDLTKAMRWFNPYNWTFLFRDETYSLREIAEAIRSVYEQSIPLAEKYEDQ